MPGPWISTPVDQSITPLAPVPSGQWTTEPTGKWQVAPTSGQLMRKGVIESIKQDMEDISMFLQHSFRTAGAGSPADIASQIATASGILPSIQDIATKNGYTPEETMQRIGRGGVLAGSMILPGAALGRLAEGGTIALDAGVQGPRLATPGLAGAAGRLVSKAPKLALSAELLAQGAGIGALDPTVPLEDRPREALRQGLSNLAFGHALGALTGGIGYAGGKALDALGITKGEPIPAAGTVPPTDVVSTTSGARASEASGSAVPTRGLPATYNKTSPFETIDPFKGPAKDAPNLQPTGLESNPAPTRLTEPPPDVHDFLANQDVLSVNHETGAVTVRGWRATPASTEPTAPGHGQSTYIASSPGEVAPFMHGLSYFNDPFNMAPPGKIHLLETTLEKPKIVADWSVLKNEFAGFKNPKRYDELNGIADQLHQELDHLQSSSEYGTDANAKDINRVISKLDDVAMEKDSISANHQDQMIEQIKKQGFDGIVITNGGEFDTEIVDFKPDRVKSITSIDPKEHMDQVEQIVNSKFGRAPSDPGYLDLKDDLSIADTQGQFAHAFKHAGNLSQLADERFPGAPPETMKDRIMALLKQPTQELFPETRIKGGLDLGKQAAMEMSHAEVSHQSYYKDMYPSQHPSYANNIANLAQDLRTKYPEMSMRSAQPTKTGFGGVAGRMPDTNVNFQDYVRDLQLTRAYNDAAKGTGLDPATLEFRRPSPLGLETSAPVRNVPDLDQLNVEGLIKSEVYRPEVGRIADVVRNEMADQAIDEAVRRIDPLSISSSPVQEIAGWAKEGNQVGKLQSVLSDFFGDETPGIVKQLLATGNLDGIQSRLPVRTAKLVQGLVNKIAAKSTVSPEPMADIIPWSLGAEHDSPVMDTWSILRRMNDKQLGSAIGSAQNALAKASPELRLYSGIPFDKLGANAITRIAFGSGGAAVLGATEDDDPSAVTQVGRTIAKVMIAAAALPLVIKGLGKVPFLRSIATMMDSRVGLANPDAKAAIEGFSQMRNLWDTAASLTRRQIEEVFPDKTARATVSALLEDPHADLRPEFQMLTDAQKKTVAANHIMNTELGGMLTDRALIKDVRQNYVRLLFSPEEAQRFYQSFSWANLNAGGFTKERIFPTIEEATDWAIKNGVKPPEADIAKLQEFHLREVGKAIATQNTMKMLSDVDLIKPIKSTSPENIPEGWRQIQVVGIGNQVAPNDVAKAVETLAQNNKLSKFEAVKVAENIRSAYMIGINLIGFAHGLNVVRAVLADTPTMAGFGRAWGAIKQADPSLLEAASHGLDVMGRGDFENIIAGKAYDSFDSSLGKIGLGGLKPLYKWSERKLFDEFVPAARYLIYQTNVNRLLQKTPEIVNDSVKYDAALKKIAEYSNTVTGQIPKYFQDPGMRTVLGQLMFSPSWTRTRLAITYNAAKELGGIGDPNIRTDSMYLKYYMRKVALGVAATYAIQKGMNFVSGEDGEATFNPHNSKVYVQTPYSDKNGRSLGVDLLGWWQDDMKLFNDPLKLLYNKAAPHLRAIGELVSGTNYLGEPVEGIDRIGQAVQSIGQPAGWASFAAGMAQDVSNGAVQPQTIIKGGTDALDIGNTASLPRPMEVMIDRYSKRLLSSQGLPTDDQRTFDLGRLLKGNLMTGRSMIDQQVVDYLGYQRRKYSENSPILSSIRQAARVVQDMQ